MRRIIVASVVVGLAAIGIALWRRFDVAHSQDLLGSAEVVRVTRRDIGTAVKATGVIKPMTGAEVNVGSSVSGVVMRLFVQIGDHVTKGQQLAELDSREFVARRDADAAALRVAQANMEYAQVDVERKRQLHAAQIIARSDLDLAEKTFSVAERQWDQARATLADSNTQLGYTEIIAPISGVVSAVSTQEGETVAASFPFTKRPKADESIAVGVLFREGRVRPKFDPISDFLVVRKKTPSTQDKTANYLSQNWRIICPGNVFQGAPQCQKTSKFL